MWRADAPGGGRPDVASCCGCEARTPGGDGCGPTTRCGIVVGGRKGAGEGEVGVDR